jgi:hypothetical protein
MTKKNPILLHATLILGLSSLFKKKKSDRRNYSLGLQSAEDIQVHVHKTEFDKAESKLKDQSLNDCTQIIDHLALSLEEPTLLAWNEATKSDFSKLSLGVFYLHKAWIARSHQFANTVSENDAVSFHDYLELCETVFDTISENATCLAELNSRKIRLYMGLGNEELAAECFKTVSEANPELIWPYIHYAEIIQPKWGGSFEVVEKFYKNLPDDFLIHSIVELKLIHDSILMEDNYFEKFNTNILTFANQKLTEIDEKLDHHVPDSIHKYILFNYMVAVCAHYSEKLLGAKYQKLMGDNFTLYPNGVLK